MSKVIIGDIVEFKTKKGLSYALYTHENEKESSLLRIFWSAYDARPEDFSEIVNGDVQFSAFFLLSHAVRLKMVEIVERCDVPDKLEEFPVFRDMGATDFYPKTAKDWRLWDGEKSWKVGDLTEKQRAFPLKGTCNLAMIVSHIEMGWTSEQDFN